MSSAPSVTALSDDAAEQTLLILVLSGESFALPVSTIHEVIDPLPVTRVPNAPPHAPGLINVRGIVTPLVDIRLRLHIPQPARTGTRRPGRVIVLELPVGGAMTRVAIRADVVQDVIEVRSSQLEFLPDLGARWPSQFVRGIARHEGALVVVLDPETLFAPDHDRPVAHA